MLKCLKTVELLDCVSPANIDPLAEKRLNALCKGRSLADGILHQKLLMMRHLNILTRDNFINLVDIVQDKLAEAIEALICLHHAEIPFTKEIFHALADWKNYCVSAEIPVYADIQQLQNSRNLTRANFILLTTKKVCAAEINRLNATGILQESYDFLMEADSAQSCACGLLIAHDGGFLTKERREKIFRHAHNDAIVSLLKLLQAAKICDEKRFDLVYDNSEILGTNNNICNALSHMPAEMLAGHFDEMLALCKLDDVAQSEKQILQHIKQLLPQKRQRPKPELPPGFFPLSDSPMSPSNAASRGTLFHRPTISSAPTVDVTPYPANAEAQKTMASILSSIVYRQ